MTVVSAPYSRNVRKVDFHMCLAEEGIKWAHANPCSQVSLASGSVNFTEHLYKLIRLAQPRFRRPFAGPS